MRDREREGKLERVSEAAESKTEEGKVHTHKPTTETCLLSKDTEVHNDFTSLRK